MNATTKQHAISIAFDVTDEDVDNIVGTALDSGISYWCREVKVVDGDYRGAQYANQVISRGGALKVYAYERPREDSKQSVFKLTLEKVLSGIRLWVIARGVELEDGAFASEVDAPRADSIIQFALFGEEVYG